MAEEKDWWDKAGVLGTLFATVMVPVILTIFGSMINASVRRSEVELRMVELAVEVLRESPTDTPDSTSLRRWAVNVIDRFSQVPLNEQAREVLIKAPLSTGPWKMETAFSVIDNETGKPIPGAVARLNLFGQVLERTSDESGQFRMPAPFNSSLTLSAKGYQTTTIPVPPTWGPITLRLARTPQLPVK